MGVCFLCLAVLLLARRALSGPVVLVLIMVVCVYYFGCFCLGFDLGLRLWRVLVRL